MFFWTFLAFSMIQRMLAIWSLVQKAREFQKNIYFCFIDYVKAFDYVDHNKLWRILRKRWEYQTTWPASWEICMQITKQQLELDMEQQTDSKSGKEYIKAVYYHPTYLTRMQSTSWDMPGWMKHKLESRLLGEILITSDTQITPSLRRFIWKFFENVKISLPYNTAIPYLCIYLEKTVTKIIHCRTFYNS